MDREPHAFEDDIEIIETVENGAKNFAAYADGKFIAKYPAYQAGVAKHARHLAAASLSHKTIKSDLRDVAVWFAETHPQLPGYFVVDRYRHRRLLKVVSHIVTFSCEERRMQIETILEEAFQALGWVIDPHGGSSVEWFEARSIDESSAHVRLKAIGRVQSALDAYRRSRE